MVNDGYEAEYEWDNEFRTCIRIVFVNAFFIVLMISWQDVRITVEEVVQSLIVRIHGKAYGLDVARALERSSKVWGCISAMSRGELFVVICMEEC